MKSGRIDRNYARMARTSIIFRIKKQQLLQILLLLLILQNLLKRAQWESWLMECCRRGVSSAVRPLGAWVVGLTDSGVKPTGGICCQQGKLTVG